MTQQIEIISPLVINGGKPTEEAIAHHRALLEMAKNAVGYAAVLDIADKLRLWKEFVEDQRKRVKAPVIDLGRDIEAAAKALDVTDEINRLKKLRFDMEAKAAAEAKAAREAARLAAEQAAKVAAMWDDEVPVEVPTLPAIVLPPATTTTRKKYSVRILDPAKIPRTFMVPELDLILAALRKGTKVEGCELVTEDQIVEKPRGAR